MGGGGGGGGQGASGIEGRPQNCQIFLNCYNLKANKNQIWQVV